MPARRKPSRAPAGGLQTRPAEQLLIDACGEIAGETIVCTSLGRAQFAAAVAEALPAARVRCHFLDLYRAERARDVHREGPSNLEVVCRPDLPAEPGEADAVGLPFSSGGEAELARDLMQAGHQALRTGGRMMAAVDNPQDTWLHGELQKLFPKVTRRPFDSGILYLAAKTAPLKKLKSYDARFAFRDRGRLIIAVSRPGVFSHRRLDLGARALLNVMEVEAGQRVLDIGCGSGVLSLAAARRAEGVRAQAVDSNARAVQCTALGAELNGLDQVTVEQSAEPGRGTAGEYDVVLTNPPYFSHYRIAEIFLQGARQALRAGGTVLVVTKQAGWYAERMPELFDDVAVREQKSYSVVQGQGRAR